MSHYDRHTERNERVAGALGAIGITLALVCFAGKALSGNAPTPIMQPGPIPTMPSKP